MKISIGCDHTAVVLKNHLIKYLKNQNHIVLDMGTNSETEKVDYPDFAQKVGTSVVNHSSDLGIVICGTGIGISIAANKIKGIRAGLVTEPWLATLTRQHNGTNVLALGAWVVSFKKAELIVDNFCTSAFEAEGRHGRRVSKINDLEKLN